jgi:photosystem II stability/assembly factor-like uncharacterized protein
MRTPKFLFFAAVALSLLILCAGKAQSVTAEPYIWRNVTIRGGGFVTGVLFHPREKNLVYARTDVGGAYRSDDAGKHWIPITDWIGGMDLTGIESFALDPSDANRVYLAAGTYSATRSAILRSADRGHTWQQTDVPFKMGGNEPGRFNGERLAVDPHIGNILFFGSRHEGLWRSTNAGVSWNRVESFPTFDDTQTAEVRPSLGGRLRRPQAVGIVFVLFIPRSGESDKFTPKIYVGVSTAGTNLFRSDNGGRTWEAVSGQPLGLRPNHAVISPDDEIYLSYGREAGPNAMTDGAVWKYIPASGTWTDITPLKSPDGKQPFGYGAVAMDAQHPANIAVTTFGKWHPHDEVFYSTNRGASWQALLQNAQYDHANAPYAEHFTPHWMGSIAIDPFDSNRVFFTTGYGIWGCENLTEASAKPTRWEFADAGLEETVPLALISPPEGAHLLSGLGDIDGFRHDDLEASPPEGAFAGPRFSNTEDLAFAACKPEIIVRTGTGGEGVHAAISKDGGKSWNTLPSQPASYPRGRGTIAISADGETIVWGEGMSVPNVSSDGGMHWKTCRGIDPGTRVLADTVNPSYFYNYQGPNGKLLISTDSAASFSDSGAGLSDFRAVEFHGSTSLAATPGKERDLWLIYPEQGLYHLQKGETNFVKIESVSSAHSLGFGKPAEGKTFPALYLAGRIGKVEGLFRSTDVGATWVRINDDQHQYGVISRVTGDPRIFGRVYFATTGRGVVYGDPAATRGN